MTDEARSRIMRAVPSWDTGPEIKVRSLIHKLGYRFRVHADHLAGKPDIVFANRRKVIFVNGCFWHGHKCPRGSRMPKTNAAYWEAKIARNGARDAGNIYLLRRTGWRVLVVWECELKDLQKVSDKVKAFLGS